MIKPTKIALISLSLAAILSANHALAGPKPHDVRASTSGEGCSLEGANSPSTSSRIKEIRDRIAANAAVSKPAEGEDITVFLGNTGVGKSTLINMLCDMPLKIDLDGKIFVDNDAPGANQAAVVKDGYTSVTKAPFLLGSKRLGIIIDLPGFNDTEGSVDDIINASIIRRIFVLAKTVRVAFLTSETELKGARGDLAKKFSQTIAMFQNQNFLATSCLVVLNQVNGRRFRSGQAGDLLAELSKYLLGETDKRGYAAAGAALNKILEQDHGHSIPNAGDVDEKEFFDAHRETLTKKIEGLRGSSIKENDLNISMALSEETLQVVRDLMRDLCRGTTGDGVMKKKYEDVIGELTKEKERGEFSDDVSDQLGNKCEDMWDFFESQVKESIEFELLEPICSYECLKTIDDFTTDFKREHQSIVNQLKIEESDRAIKGLLEETKEIEKARIEAEEMAAMEANKARQSEQIAQQQRVIADQAQQDARLSKEEKMKALEKAKECEQVAEENRRIAEEAKSKAREREMELATMQKELSEKLSQARSEYERQVSKMNDEMRAREERSKRQEEELRRELASNREELSRQLESHRLQHEREMREAAERHKASLDKMDRAIDEQKRIAEEARAEAAEARAAAATRAEPKEQQTVTIWLVPSYGYGYSGFY